MATFHAQAEQEVWASLPWKTQKAMMDKARNEHMTLTAVMREWWPEVWKRMLKQSEELFAE